LYIKKQSNEPCVIKKEKEKKRLLLLKEGINFVS